MQEHRYREVVEHRTLDSVSSSGVTADRVLFRLHEFVDIKDTLGVKFVQTGVDCLKEPGSSKTLI